MTPFRRKYWYSQKVGRREYSFPDLTARLSSMIVEITDSTNRDQAREYQLKILP